MLELHYPRLKMQLPRMSERGELWLSWGSVGLCGTNHLILTGPDYLMDVSIHWNIFCFVRWLQRKGSRALMLLSQSSTSERWFRSPVGKFSEMHMRSRWGWYLLKPVELSISGERDVYGDERPDEQERLQRFLPTTTPSDVVPGERRPGAQGQTAHTLVRGLGPPSVARRASLWSSSRGSDCSILSFS